MFDPRAVDTYRLDADNFVGGYKNLLLQVRTGQMTMDALHHIESVGRLLLGKQKGPIGAFMILEETAEVADKATRAEQTRVIREFYQNHARCFAVATIVGAGPRAALMRAVMRVLVMAQPRFTIASQLPDAASWMGPRVGLPEQELIDLGDWIRHLANEPPISGTLRASAR